MSAGPMFDSPYAPEGMGREFINSPRKPLSEYVGASIEIPGGGGKAWDPMSFSELWKVSANNPDVAWLREVRHVPPARPRSAMARSGGSHACCCARGA